MKCLDQISEVPVPTLIILENPYLFNSSHEDTVQITGSINAGFTWYVFEAPLSYILANKGCPLRFSVFLYNLCRIPCDHDMVRKPLGDY